MKKIFIEILGWSWYLFFTFGVMFYSFAVIYGAVGFDNWTAVNILQLTVSVLSVIAMLVTWGYITYWIMVMLVKDIKKFLRTRKRSA